MDKVRKAAIAGIAGLALVFGAACTDAGGDNGDNGGVSEDGGGDNGDDEGDDD